VPPARSQVRLRSKDLEGRRSQQAGQFDAGTFEVSVGAVGMAVLVKPNGLFGAAYMAGIKPLRYLRGCTRRCCG